MCPCGAIDLVPEGNEYRIKFNLWKCSFCGTCQQVCPDDAVRLTSDYAIQAAEKAGMAVQGAMERTTCAICGKPHIAKAQLEAVRSRVECIPALRKHSKAVDSALSTCQDCKSMPRHQARTRKEMAKWAYE